MEIDDRRQFATVDNGLEDHDRFVRVEYLAFTCDDGTGQATRPGADADRCCQFEIAHVDFEVAGRRLLIWQGFFVEIWCAAAWDE